MLNLQLCSYQWSIIIAPVLWHGMWNLSDIYIWRPCSVFSPWNLFLSLPKIFSNITIVLQGNDRSINLIHLEFCLYVFSILFASLVKTLISFVLCEYSYAICASGSTKILPVFTWYLIFFNMDIYSPGYCCQISSHQSIFQTSKWQSMERCVTGFTSFPNCNFCALPFLKIKCALFLKSLCYLAYSVLCLVDQWFNDCTDDIRVCCSNALAELYDQYGWKVLLNYEHPFL